MRVKPKDLGRKYICTCLICNKKFTDSSIQSFCRSCFIENSKVQIKVIIESGKSFEDFVIEQTNRHIRMFNDNGCEVGCIEMIKEENDVLYALYRERLANPLPEETIKTVMGIPIKIIK